MKKYTKLFQTKATSIDEQNHTVQFVISDNSVDRYEEIVDQKTWNLKDYLNNPIVLWGHDPNEPENVLGTALEVTPQGTKTIATLKLDADINPKAALVWNQIVRGTLRCVSVGFMNHSLEWEDDTAVLKDNDLLEISIVPIPANPNAIALALKEGSIKAKDARWLMDSMKKEAALLEEQLKAIPADEKEQNVDELKDQMSQLTGAIADLGTKMTESLTALAENATKQTDSITALTETLSQKATETKPEGSQKPKLDADGKPVLDADGKPVMEDVPAPKPKLDADGKPVLDADGKPVMEDDESLAKGGDDDQSGAKTELDDLDLDAELTPEQEAALAEKLDSELS